MTATDFIQKFMLKKIPVRGAIVRLSETLQSIHQQHQYPVAISELITESVLSAALCTSTIKWQGRFVLQFQGNDCLKTLVVRLNHKRQVSAMARWDQTQLNHSQPLLCNGQLQTSLIQSSKTPYQSIIPINTAGIMESLEDYFHHSEQLPTKIWLCGDGMRGQGLMLQQMPTEHTEVSFDFASLIHSLQENSIDFNFSNTHILKSAFPDRDCELFSPQAIEFHCGCSIEKMKQAIISLGRKAVDQELALRKEIEVRCEFCNQALIVTPTIADEIFKPNRSPDPS
jgi:molecular chaperone Hsp33